LNNVGNALAGLPNQYFEGSNNRARQRCSEHFRTDCRQMRTDRSTLTQSSTQWPSWRRACYRGHSADAAAEQQGADVAAAIRGSDNR